MRYFSTFHEDKDILNAFSDIFLKGSWFEADITYSKGIFYKEICKPKEMYDLIPTSDEVIQQDSRLLDKMQDNSYKSIVFDPPFLFRNRKSDNNDKISKRFSYFKSYDELIEMYRDSLQAVIRKLSRGGVSLLQMPGYDRRKLLLYTL